MLTSSVSDDCEAYIERLVRQAADGIPPPAMLTIGASDHCLSNIWRQVESKTTARHILTGGALDGCQAHVIDPESDEC